MQPGHHEVKLSVALPPTNIYHIMEGIWIMRDLRVVRPEVSAAHCAVLRMPEGMIQILLGCTRMSGESAGAG